MIGFQGMNLFTSIVSNSLSKSFSVGWPDGSMDESEAIFKRSYFLRDGISVALGGTRI